MNIINMYIQKIHQQHQHQKLQECHQEHQRLEHEIYQHVTIARV